MAEQLIQRRLQEEHPLQGVVLGRALKFSYDPAAKGRRLRAQRPPASLCQQSRRNLRITADDLELFSQNESFAFWRARSRNGTEEMAEDHKMFHVKYFVTVVPTELHT